MGDVVGRDPRARIARDEAAAIAHMLLLALDREQDCCEDAGGGALQRHELPMRGFAALDAEHDADGDVTHEELEAAVLRLSPAARRRLGERLRPLALAHVRHARRVKRLFPFTVAAIVGVGLLLFSDRTEAAMAAFALLLLPPAAMLLLDMNGAARAQRAIAALLDDALG